MDKWKNECLTFLAPSLLLRTVLQPFDSRESTRYSETRHLWPELIGPEENTWPKPGQKSPSLGILSSGYWGSLVSLCCRSHKIQNLDSCSFLIFYMVERECNWYTKTKRGKKGLHHPSAWSQNSTGPVVLVSSCRLLVQYFLWMRYLSISPIEPPFLGLKILGLKK